LLDGYSDIDPYILGEVDRLFKANYNPGWLSKNLKPEDAAKVCGAGLFFPVALPWREIATHASWDAATLRYFWRCWRSSLRHRLTIDEFRRKRNLEPAFDVFMTCSAWAHTSLEDADRRNEIITRLKRLPIRFAGGFRSTPDARERFPDNTMQSEYSWLDYVRTMAVSKITVANRGMVEAYSWKLGEQLALGRCILAEPNLNTLPVPLDHGVHVLYLERDLRNLEDTVLELLRDTNKRSLLQRNAANVFDEYFAPDKDAARILREVGAIDFAAAAVVPQTRHANAAGV